MKYRSYNVKAGSGWYEVLPLYREGQYFERIKNFWLYGIRGNFYFYMQKWFGMKLRLTKRDKQYLEMLDSLDG